MKLKIARDRDEMSCLADAWLRHQSEQGVDDVFLPAGSTCRGLYALWRAAPPPHLDRLRPVQLDEVVTGASAGIFENFFRAELPAALVARMSWVRENPPTARAALLGFGKNGHVAFHEPGLPREFSFGCVRLSDESVKNLRLEPGSWGLTFGTGAFVTCQAILLLISGEGKDDALRGFLSGDSSIPASALRQNPALTVIVDASTVNAADLHASPDRRYTDSTQ